MTGSALTYHCTNCSAPLSFDPEKQKFCCEYCLSEFTEPELMETMAAQKIEDAASAAAEAADAAREVPDEEFSASLNGYSCASCGAEIMADEHTAADICPYCHNPVLMAGRLAGQIKPHKVIPFKFEKEEAIQRFFQFAGKKWFVPKDFKAPEQVEKIRGVYYPFWVTDADVGASLAAKATRVRTWSAGGYRYTETSNYHIRRQGEIHFEDIVTPALTEEDREMLNGILPYPSDSLLPFSMPYLSGFLAKKRNVEQEAVREAVRQRMVNYATTLLRNTIQGYTTVTPTAPRMLTRALHWDYTLMPIYILNYTRKGKTYTYAMNGYTGKVYGQFPVSGKKLALLGALSGLAAGIVMGLLKLFLFR